MNAKFSCHKCDFETNEQLAKCPQCGRRLQSTKKVRILGWLLLVLGTGLVIFMGTLAVIIGQIIAGSDEPGATTRFTGGSEAITLIVTVFGLVISFGLASMIGGVWQIRYGKPNKKIMVAMFVVAGLLFVIGRAIKGFG